VTVANVERRIEQFQKNLQLVREEVGRIIVGNRDVVDGVMTCLLARGHVLIEGAPGIGKTSLAHTLATSIGGTFKRIRNFPNFFCKGTFL
jgi:MoxR-like ATPase